MVALFLKNIRYIIYAFFANKASKPKYRIVEVNTDSQEMTFCAIGKSVLLKRKFSDAVGDNNLISGLLPMDACWLGGYYGKSLKDNIAGRNKFKKSTHISHLLDNPLSQYRIFSIKRNGDIVYCDKNSKVELSGLPLILARDESIISRFHPTQACYIGVLAGLNFEKKLQSTNKDSLEFVCKKPPSLRLVK